MFAYETLSGFFSQDDPLAIPATIGAEWKVPPRFGLLDPSDERWSKLSTKLSGLNTSGGANTSYKLFFFGRHGQGYHNLGREKYGNQAWDDYWSKLDGDGALYWGPDAELTAIGKDQAAAVNKRWKEELAAMIPLPDKLYCSPMRRAIQTNIITFEGVSSRRPVIVENCREEYGVHRCDQRSTRSYIADTFPQFDIEDGFTEKDELWQADSCETAAHIAGRAQSVLERIFLEDKDAVFVSITAHAFIINNFLHTLGRPRYVLPVGGVLPIVVKATAVTN
ncbi:histidine phosphatase superfamily [Mycena albidolilacea]|uniref:Histidine phosphatase superfamily n=1 Tax=Mycena albidolilacea TaxID=1033008 RepID=A0AAD7EIM5_9AGAR|nr:histidine phosphatase superfamily [Mycena albidolilacea]